MYGLLLYDILSIRRLLKTYGIVLLFYIVLGVWSGAASNFGLFFVLFATTVPLTLFANRERAHWDLYANVMPIARKYLIFESYIFSWMLLVFAMVCNFLMIIVDTFLGQIQGWGDVVAQLQVLIVVLFFGFLYISVFLPVLFKFGPEKGRIVMFLFYAIPILFYMIVSKKIDLFEIIQRLENMTLLSFYALLLVTMIVTNIVSIIVSVKVYEKKDLN